MSAIEAVQAFQGDRTSGKDVRRENVAAVQTLANILKTSLGPQGLDKMLVDDIGELTVTNDGATILKQLEVKHAAAKILVDLSDLQDKEVGDGTTTVVLLAAELLKRGNQLIDQGLHPTSVVSGYRLALKESLKYMSDTLMVSSSLVDDKMLNAVARTSLSSKIIGGDSNFFAEMVVRAVNKIKTIDDMGSIKCPIAAVSICKTHGKSSRESFLVEGIAVSHTGRASQQMPRTITNAKIALLDFGLRQYRLQLGVVVQIDDPDELERVRLKEKDICKERVEKILAAGANVVVTTQGIDDLALKYFVEAGAIAVRRVSKKDMRRISRLSGGKVVLTMAQADDDSEHFDPSWLGHCGEVCEERVGDWDYMFFKDGTQDKSCSFVLRGANDFMLDEVERCVHDALCAAARAAESSTLCVGGGTVEAALSLYLSDFAQTLGSREQLAVAEFGEALLIIPKTLAVNAALDASELVAKLRAYHHVSQRANDDEKKQELKWSGLDLTEGRIRNNLTAGVLEPAAIKMKALRFACEAANTLLRIDDVIRLTPDQSSK